MRLFLSVATLLVGLLLPTDGLIAAPSSDFSQGNALYAQGKFAEAAAAYERGVQTRQYSAQLFFNLGNARYRLGDRGHAILNYERALLLDPIFAEAARNLAFVRKTNASNSAATASVGPWGVDGWTVCACLAGWLAIFALGSALLRPASRGPALAFAALGILLCGGAIWAVISLHGGATDPARALILADETRVLYSPADNAKAVTNLAVGSEVHLLSADGAWDYVQTAQGVRGWVTADRVETLVPAGAGNL